MMESLMAWVVAGSEKSPSTAGTGRITYTLAIRFWTSLADTANSRLLQIRGTVPSVNRTKNKTRIPVPMATIVRVLVFGRSGLTLLIQLPGRPAAHQAIGHWDEEQRKER